MELPMKHLFYILLLMFTAASLSADTRIDFLLGDVKIQPQGTASWQNAESGRAVRTGDTMQTGKKSFAVINADGNSIKIQANTKVRFTQDFIDNRQQSSLALFGGSVNCKMDRLKKNNNGYNVNTASSVCAVRGTEFDVAASADGKTILQVTEGTVALSGTKKSVDVSGNQESSVRIGGEPEPVKIVKRQDWEKWADETGSDVRGKEKDIIDGCLVKMQKLDSDIIQLERESAAEKSKSDELKKQSADAKKAGDNEKAMKLAGEAEKIFRSSSSLKNKACYQSSRMELVKSVADNAYNSSEKKNFLDKPYRQINRIYDKYFIKYIKPILDSAKLRQEIMDNKKKKK